MPSLNNLASAIDEQISCILFVFSALCSTPSSLVSSNWSCPQSDFSSVSYFFLFSSNQNYITQKT
jgi:hypothetical protein